MAQQHESFNLDRVISIEHNVDAFGRKWEIQKKSRESTLFIAVPNPFRPDFVCPNEFKGAWTKVELLQEKITLYLNRSWDKAESPKEVRKSTRKTPKESLDSLSKEVKDVLGETIAVA